MRTKYQSEKANWQRLRITWLLSIFLLAALPIRAFVTQDVIEEVVSRLNGRDVNAVSAYFADTVEMDMVSGEKTCSKAEATNILQDFLAKHPINSSKIVHRIESKVDYKVAIVQVQTSNGTFRITISLKSIGNKFRVTEMRTERQ